MSFNISSTAGTSGVSTIQVSASATTDVVTKVENYTLTNSGKSITMQIIQKPVVPLNKYINLVPSAITIDSSGGTASLQIQSNDDWVIGSEGWIQLSRYAEQDRGGVSMELSGNGNTILGIRATENTGSTRNGTITGYCLSNTALTASTTVSQTGNYVAPYITLSYNSISCDYTGITSSVTVSSNIDWYASVDESWITISPSSGSGNGTISFVVSQNNTSIVRSCDIAVYDVVYGIKTSLTIRQSESEEKPYIVLDPDSFLVQESGSTGNTIHVSANCSYDITTDTDWITLHSSSGSGDGTVTFDTDPAPLIKFNTGLIEFSNSALSRYVTVERQSAEKYLSASTDFITISNNETNTVTVDVDSNVEWNVSVNYGDIDGERLWLIVSPLSGNGNGSISITTMSGNTERTATIQLYNNTYGLSYNITLFQIDSRTIYYTTNNGQTATTYGQKSEYPSYFYDENNNELTIISNTYTDGLGRMVVNGEIKKIKSRLTVGGSYWYAFWKKTELTSLIFPDTIDTININSLSGCSNLVSVVLPKNLTGSAGFHSCSSLTGVTIPENVTNIDFCGCNSLVEIEIPSGVTSIENHGFASCYTLTQLTIPNGVTHINDCTFLRCSGLTEITIHSGVTIMDRSVFSSTNIKTIYMYPQTQPTVIATTYDSQGYHMGTFSGLPKGGTLHYPIGSNYSNLISCFNSYNTGNNWTFIGDL